jgi:FMN phosphatase YigB (HAD superfamily)
MRKPLRNEVLRWRVVLFDLGRVTIDIDFNVAFAKWAEYARCDRAVIARRFSHDEAHKRHEQREIDADQLFYLSTLGSRRIDLKRATTRRLERDSYRRNAGHIAFAGKNRASGSIVRLFEFQSRT